MIRPTVSCCGLLTLCCTLSCSSERGTFPADALDGYWQADAQELAELGEGGRSTTLCDNAESPILMLLQLLAEQPAPDDTEADEEDLSRKLIFYEFSAAGQTAALDAILDCDTRDNTCTPNTLGEQLANDPLSQSFQDGQFTYTTTTDSRELSEALADAPIQLVIESTFVITQISDSQAILSGSLDNTFTVMQDIAADAILAGSPALTAGDSLNCAVSLGKTPVLMKVQDPLENGFTLMDDEP